MPSRNLRPSGRVSRERNLESAFISDTDSSKNIVKQNRGAMLLIALLASLAVGCDSTETVADDLDFGVQFSGGTVRIETGTDTFALEVEIAETESQRRMGLMHRTSLAADSGMIFLFQTEQAPENVFWMYNTLIPLSIAYMDAEGTIGSIRDMEPCTSPYPQYCPNYEARVPYWSALEVNRGYFEQHGIGVGDRVVLERE